MADLGSLFYNVRLRDLTDQDIQTISNKLRSIGIDLDPKKFKDSILKAVEDAEKRQFKLDIDSKVFADNVRNALKSGIKCDIDPQNVRQSIENKLAGQAVKAEIVPLATKLRQAIKDAVKDNGGPLEVQIGPKASLLQRLVSQVLSKSGFMINISTVTGLETAIKTITSKGHSITLHADPTAIAVSVRNALSSMQSRDFGLQVSRDILHRSIEQALKGKTFDIQIQVMKNQARQAVQNALNQASNITAADALKYQRLMTGESKAARAELDRLKAAHIGASNAASAHARVSASLGGAMGSNIRIAGELGAAMASLYSIHQAKEFLSQVIEIGGELEHQKIALDTIFGDKGKTSELFGQIKGLARQSPFGVMEITKSVKALAAYGVQYNEVFDTAKRLADISAATSVDINRLILAFGKTKSRTFLDGLEAKQFAYANIPIYDLLSKKLTELEGKFVSVQDVMKRIKGREIGFDLVKDVLWDMTDEGGKFYNMQEQLAGSVKTAWKLVRDNIELMFGEIAESAVGDSLKSVAQILQGLTKNWREVATLGGIMAGGFAIYKTAVMAANIVTAQHSASQIKALAAKRAMIVANANAAASYRELTQAELTEMYAAKGAAKINGLAILSKTKLTGTEAEALMAKKLLTREDILRLVALKKITAAEAEYALVTVGMTQKDIALVQAEIAKANAVGKGAAMLDIAKGKALGLLGILKGFLFNPFMLLTAAIAAVVHLWQRNSEEMEKIEDIGKNLFTKAQEGADNLHTTLQSLASSVGLTTLELQQGIETMRNAIKDYSPDPINDINDSLVAQDGHVRSLAEQYDVLKGKVEQLAASYGSIKGNHFDKDMLEGAMKATDGGNLFTQMFDDDIVTNAKDYTKALKKRTDAVAEFANKHNAMMHNALYAAQNADKAFMEATRGMQSYEEVLSYFVDNSGKYIAAVQAFNRNVGSGFKLYELQNADEVINTYDTLISDTDRFIAEMNARMKLKGINPLAMTPEQKQALSISLQAMLNEMSEAGDEAKAIIAKKSEEAWQGVVVMPDKIGPAMQDKFRQLAKGSSDAMVQEAIKVIRFEGYDKLSDAQKKAVAALGENAKKQVMSDLSITTDEMQKYLANKPLTQIIQLAYTTDQSNPSDLEKELVKQKGYPGYTNSVQPLVHKWTQSNSVYSARNAAQEALQNAKNELDAAKKANAGIAEAQKAYDEVWAALSYLGWTDLATKDQKSNKEPKGSQKDPVAELLKQRFKDLKDAWSEIQKWEKSVGKDAAFDKVADSGLFSMLPEDKIPRTAEEFRERVVELEDELEKAGIKGHSQRESLLNELLKEILAIDKSQVDERIKSALDSVEREYDRQLRNWDLYDSVRKATGNEPLAVSIAFGVDSDADTDYVSLVKSRFNAMAKAARDAARLNKKPIKILDFDEINDSNKQTLPDELQKAWEDATKKLGSYSEQQRKHVSGILQEYQSAQEKVVQLAAERDEKIRQINARDKNGDFMLPNAAKRENLTQKVRSAYDYKIFQQSAQYLNFFNGVLSMSEREVDSIGRKIREALDRQLQNGQISAKEYCDEIEKINGQLDKFRQKTSGAASFFKGGLNQLFKDNFDKAQSDLDTAIDNYSEAEGKFKIAQENGDTAGMKQAQSAMDAASAMQKGAASAIKGAQGAMGAVAAIDTIVHGINDTVQGIHEAFGSIAEMADSFGVDTGANSGWGAAGAFLDAFSQASAGATKAWDSLKSGNIGGVISGVVQSVTSWFTVFNRWHDAKLRERIEDSKKRFTELGYLVDAIERRMEHFLGNRKFSLVPGIEDDIAALNEYQSMIDKMKRQINQKSSYNNPFNLAILSSFESQRDKYKARVDAYNKGGALGYERQIMTEELAELEQQKRDMEAMKKKDPEAIAEITAQIDEQKQAIRDFAEEMAETVYGINLSDWAEQFGDALVDAFAKGEDAAEAFDKTAGNILRSLVSKMASTNILAPMFKDLQDYLFGEDGLTGAYGEDFELDANEVGAMKKYLDTIRDKGIPAVENLYNAINEATGGLLDDVEGADNTVRAGIQNITEDTADLLASYINAIRAYCAENNLNFNEFFRDTMPRLSAIAEGQLAQLTMIAENTRRNMVAAEAMQQSAVLIEQTLTRATRDKSYGFYVR